MASVQIAHSEDLLSNRCVGMTAVVISVRRC